MATQSLPNPPPTLASLPAIPLLKIAKLLENRDLLNLFFVSRHTYDVISSSSVLRRKVASTAFRYNEDYMSTSFVDTCIDNLIGGEYYLSSTDFRNRLVDNDQRAVERSVKMDAKNCYLVINDRPFIIYPSENRQLLCAIDVETGRRVFVVNKTKAEDYEKIMIHNMTAVFGRSHSLIQRNWGIYYNLSLLRWQYDDGELYCTRSFILEYTDIDRPGNTATVYNISAKKMLFICYDEALYGYRIICGFVELDRIDPNLYKQVNIGKYEHFPTFRSDTYRNDFYDNISSDHVCERYVCNWYIQTLKVAMVVKQPPSSSTTTDAQELVPNLCR